MGLQGLSHTSVSLCSWLSVVKTASSANTFNQSSMMVTRDKIYDRATTQQYSIASIPQSVNDWVTCSKLSVCVCLALDWCNQSEKQSATEGVGQANDWVSYCQWYDVETTINSDKLSQDWLEVKEIQFTENRVFFLCKKKTVSLNEINSLIQTAVTEAHNSFIKQ